MYFLLCWETQKKLNTMCIICEILAEESRTRVLAPSKSMLENWNPSKADEWMPKRDEGKKSFRSSTARRSLFCVFLVIIMPMESNMCSGFTQISNFLHLLHTTAQRDEKKEEKNSMIIECWARSLFAYNFERSLKDFEPTHESAAWPTAAAKKYKAKRAAAWKESKKNFDRIYSHDTPEESVTVPKFQRAHRNKKKTHSTHNTHQISLRLPLSFALSLAAAGAALCTPTHRTPTLCTEHILLLVQPPKSSGRTTAPLIGDNRCVVLSSL